MHSKKKGVCAGVTAAVAASASVSTVGVSGGWVGPSMNSDGTACVLSQKVVIAMVQRSESTHGHTHKHDQSKVENEQSCMQSVEVQVQVCEGQEVSVENECHWDSSGPIQWYMDPESEFVNAALHGVLNRLSMSMSSKGSDSGTVAGDRATNELGVSAGQATEIGSIRVIACIATDADTSAGGHASGSGVMVTASGDPMSTQQGRACPGHSVEGTSTPIGDIASMLGKGGVPLVGSAAGMTMDACIEVGGQQIHGATMFVRDSGESSQAPATKDPDAASRYAG